MTESTPKLPCTACGRDLYDKETNSLYIAVQIGWPAAPAFQRIYPELRAPNRVNICYVCWLRSLGVKQFII